MKKTANGHIFKSWFPIKLIFHLPHGQVHAKFYLPHPKIYLPRAGGQCLMSSPELGFSKIYVVVCPLCLIGGALCWICRTKWQRFESLPLVTNLLCAHILTAKLVRARKLTCMHVPVFSSVLVLLHTPWYAHIRYFSIVHIVYWLLYIRGILIV